MSDLLGVATAFPPVVFTVLLGVVIAYWLLVFLGALSVNLLGAGDVGLDGHGHDLGLDGHGHDLDLDLDGGPGQGHDGPDLGEGISILGALKLRSAPATLVLSLVVTFSWLFSVLLTEALHGYAPALEGILARLAILVVAPVLSLPLTSLAIRPLAPLFVVHRAPGHKELVGRVVVIRSGRVTSRVGEATFDDGAAGLIVQVRCDDEGALGRGDQALLVSWDEATDQFVVTPMQDLLKDREPAREPLDADAVEGDDLTARRARR